MASAAAALALAGAGASPAMAEPAAGVINGTNLLVTLDSGAPGALTSIKPITGLQADERIAALDFRHLQGLPDGTVRLYGLGVISNIADSLRLYTIDMGTGVASPAGAAFSASPTGSAYGMDFNPVAAPTALADRIRIVSDADFNVRFKLSDLATNVDTSLLPAGKKLVAVANDRVQIPFGLPTNLSTTYGISAVDNTLVTLGGLNGSPSGNGGSLANVIGPLGIAIVTNIPHLANVNFDISTGGTAYLTATPGALPTPLPSLYTVNLTTGAATQVGTLAAPLSAFTTVPSSTVHFQGDSASVAESGAATLTVGRSGATGHTTTVGYATSDGTATGADYTATTGALTFAPGETAKTITVPITTDGDVETDETFGVTLSAPSAPATPGSPSVSTVTIVNDDVVAPPIQTQPSSTTPAPTPTAADTTPPSLTVSGVASSLTRKALLKGLTVTVASNEPAALVAQLHGTVKRAQAAAFNLALATAKLGIGTGKRTLKLKPSSRLFGKPRTTVKVRLVITATDVSGNARATSRTISVKP